ncbi:MAG TPA: efflux RND transporter permease subunit [Gemmataceae bacterium]|nr:efflux RND transporter permease subunit [Gemmataceae bacterium]
MWLVNAALRRPYTVWVGMMLVLVLGVVSYYRTPTDILPNLKVPVVVVFASYRGMPAPDMEKSITAPLERALTKCDHLEHIESRSLLGIGIIKVYFRSEVDADVAASQVISLVNAEMQFMPPGFLPPSILKYDATAIPVGNLVISSKSRDDRELLDLADHQIRDELAGIEGLASAPVFGGVFRQVQIYVHPRTLEALRLSPMDVSKIVNSQSQVIPTGEIRIGQQNYYVSSNSMVTDPKEFAKIPLWADGRKLVYLGDVADIKDDARWRTNTVRADGEQAVYMPLLRQAGASATRVVDNVQEFLPQLHKRGSIPDDVDVAVVFDQSQYVRDSLSNLRLEALGGAVLASLVVLLFLGSLRSTWIVALSIPLSILAAFAGLYLTGHTLNIMTLGGLALVIGRLVDDSIVAVENTVRHLGMGKTPLQATRDSAEEIGGPILIATITTVVVFLPLIFMEGIGKYLFTPLAVSAALAMFASYFVARTVSPLYCARMLRPPTGPERSSWFRRLYDRFEGVYEWSLRVCLHGRWLVVAALLALLVPTVWGLTHIGQELFPEVDASEFTIHMRASGGPRVEETEKEVARIEQMIRDEVPSEDLGLILSNVGLSSRWSAIYTPNNGPHAAFVRVQLRSGFDGRRTPTAEYVRRIRERLEKTRGLDTNDYFFETGGMIRGILNSGAVAPIEVQVYGRNALDRRDVVRKLDRLLGSPQMKDKIKDTYMPQGMTLPQLRIEVDRTKAALLGFTQTDVIRNVIAALMSSAQIAPNFLIDPKTGDPYIIAVQYPQHEVVDIQTLENIPISSDKGRSSGGQVRLLKEVSRVVRTQGSVEVFHQNIHQVDQLFISVKGNDLAGVAAEVERLARDMEDKGELPRGVRIEVHGEVSSMRSSFAWMTFTLILAVLLVYLIMAAQFSSWLDPLIMIVAAPLGVIGVTAILLATGTSLNIQSFMGVLMMVGISVSNSVLLVEFANRQRAAGLDTFAAVVRAARVRLRPILMTTVATIVGLLPLALHLRPGDEMNVPLARAVVGGLAGSTLLTLFVVPVLYVFLKPAGAARPEPEAEADLVTA